MKEEHIDLLGKPIVERSHVVVRVGPFSEQHGVVIGFDERMMPGDGPIVVYMRRAPDSLFDHGDGCFITKEHRLGMPAIEDANMNPLAVAFRGFDLMVLNDHAPEDLTGQIQARRCQLTLAAQRRLGMVWDRPVRRQHGSDHIQKEFVIPGL